MFFQLLPKRKAAKHSPAFAGLRFNNLLYAVRQMVRRNSLSACNICTTINLFYSKAKPDIPNWCYDQSTQTYGNINY